MDTAEIAKKSFLETFNKAKSNQLNELRKKNEFCDLTVKCDDGLEIKVHRAVVSSSSKYFTNLLSIPKNKKIKKSISLPNITGDVLEKIITFIYTSEFTEEIEVVEKIIKYAVIFQLKELVEICSLALSESITDHSCMKYWQFAKSNLIYSLKDKCLTYIASKADLFEITLMSDLTIDEMRSLLTVNRLHLQCDEEKIFEHVWKWIEGKISETKSFSNIFSEFVDLFNYAKLKNEFVFQKMFDNEDVLANTELLKKVSKLTKRKHSDDLTENAEPLQKIAKLTKPNCKDEPATPIRFRFDQSTQRLFGFVENKMFIGLGEDNIIENEIDLRRDFGYTTFDNKLLICGGLVDQCSTNSCELFEPSTHQWKTFSSMNTGRRLHGCSYLDNKIYACGGHGRKTVEMFDLGKGKWDFGPEMLANNWNFGLTGVNGALYAIGGYANNVTILDLRTQKWNLVYRRLRGSYEIARCISIGSCIFCFSDEKRSIFDTRINKFTEEICCEDFHRYFNLCELDGYIYGLGYQRATGDKYSLDLVQYHLDGKQGFKISYGFYNRMGTTQPAIVSLCY